MFFDIMHLEWCILAFYITPTYSAVMAGAPVSRRCYTIGYRVNMRPIRALKVATIIAGEVPTRMACLE